MNEVICAMRVIKMYAWEYAFKKMVEKLRRLAINVKSSTLPVVIISAILIFFFFLCFVLQERNMAHFGCSSDTG